MAGVWHNAAAWLGLVADDRYADDRYPDERYDEEPTAARPGRALESYAEEDEVTEPASYPPEPGPQEADLSRIITVHPRTYNEARTIGEHYREGIPVIMNLTDMDDADAKRLVDFAAGLTFGLHGRIERVTSKVFLLSPHNISVAAEDKERIAGGFFNQS